MLLQMFGVPIRIIMCCLYLLRCHHHYYHLGSSVKCECFLVHVYFSNKTVFPDNCDDWTNENVSFGAQNYETNIHCFIVHISRLNTNGSNGSGNET